MRSATKSMDVIAAMTIQPPIRASVTARGSSERSTPSAIEGGAAGSSAGGESRIAAVSAGVVIVFPISLRSRAMQVSSSPLRVWSHADRLQRRQGGLDLAALRLKPRRQDELLTEMGRVFVDREAGSVGGDFEEH